MQHPLVVNGGQRAAKLPDDLDPLLLGHAPHPLQDGGEVFAINELHREERLPVVLRDVVHPTDVRVAHPPRRRDFLAEAGEPTGVVREKGR